MFKKHFLKINKILLLDKTFFITWGKTHHYLLFVWYLCLPHRSLMLYRCKNWELFMLINVVSINKEVI